MYLKEFLIQTLEGPASDLHLVPGLRPLFRIHTELREAEEHDPVTEEMTEKFVREMIGPKRFEQFLEVRDVDFSIQIEEVGRFRVNAHYQRNCIAIAFRTISESVPPLDELNLPQVVQNLVDLPRGLVLVTGVTGSGKSTTLASMIEAMNERYHHHVITLEDPVEYLIRSKQCVVEQREVGSDAPSFASGLKHVLRQDPDIILVGEMRDLETTSAAITAAETGHLVLSTLHTQDAAQTIERIIDIYPGEQQNQIRSMLSNTLQAVISQVLFKRADRPGMVPACEVMLCTPAVRACVREARIHEIPNIISTSRALGMCTLDDCIKRLVLNGQITRQQGLSRAVSPSSMRQALCA